ncbi:hypothetical protein [Paludibacterium yongneupense]|uniref:hypothetical protein n=1 Tax=Paludibacterium yongneupense TaxID=400061 RepID=UPI000491A774|nr:hypothetical protein [Paludibacterium yongneupense]
MPLLINTLGLLVFVISLIPALIAGRRKKWPAMKVIGMGVLFAGVVMLAVENLLTAIVIPLLRSN